MDNCYGKGDRIPRELLHNKDDRLTNKHIQTLSFLQDIVNENNVLKQRKEELEKEQEKCQDIHAMAEESQLRIKDIEENCLKRADEVNQVLADQHRDEMMQVLDEKSEIERSMKEEILKLRHELESLRRTNSVLQKDTEWRNEKQALLDRITELELLAEGLQMEVEEKRSERKTLQTSLAQSQALNSELHQLQNLRTINQTLTDELKETNQKNQEFVYMIDKLQQRLKDQSTEEEHTKLMQALKNKTAKLLKEKELAEMRVEDVKSQCDELAVLNDDFWKKVDLLQKECDKVARDLTNLQVEHSKLNRRLQHGEDNAALQEFWAVKRELSAMKEENEILKLKVRSVSACSLPPLKDDQSSQERPVSKPKGKKKVLSISSTPAQSSPLPGID